MIVMVECFNVSNFKLVNPQCFHDYGCNFPTFTIYNRHISLLQVAFQMDTNDMFKCDIFYKLMYHFS
jgi:hypothetical protein